jgi:hypothetical protein
MAIDRACKTAVGRIIAHERHRDTAFLRLGPRRADAFPADVAPAAPGRGLTTQRGPITLSIGYGLRGPCDRGGRA